MSDKRVLLGVLMASVLVLAGVVGWGVVGRSQAAPPGQSPDAGEMTVPYAGQLSDMHGEPVADGAYDLTFALYATQTGGQALWQETQTGVAVGGGSFRVQLGSVTAIPEEVLAGDGGWLAVAVRGLGEEDFTTLAPRQRVSAAAVASSEVNAAAGASCPHDHWGETWTGSGDRGLDVRGTSIGVFGTNTATQNFGSLGGPLSGVQGNAYCDNCDGVLGYSTRGNGVFGYSDNHGVYGKTDGDWSYRSGVYGEASKANANGVTGWNTGAGPGVYAYSKNGTALYAKSVGSRGVYAARFTSEDGDGLYAGTGAQFGYAAYFNGDVSVTGNLSKPGGGFKVDHPLDPANKYLNHSFVESPDMKNLYDGVVVLDGDGAAWVELPEWFEAVNEDFRYQLTPIGAPAPGLYIAHEIESNRFRIAGGEPGLKISWQVAGTRHDRWADAHPMQVEQAKPPEEQGTYLHPAEHGKPQTLGLDYQRNQPPRQFETGGE